MPHRIALIHAVVAAVPFRVNVEAAGKRAASCLSPEFGHGNLVAMDGDKLTIHFDNAGKSA